MHLFSSEIISSKNEEIIHPILKNAGVTLDVKREDLIHKQISGNKFRKLKYNLLQAKALGYTKILTFGGAYSNHILATAAAADLMNLQAIGIIRGEELSKDLQKTLSENSTLKFASRLGMDFEFISRESYRLKHTDVFLNTLKQQFGDFYLIPEGGTNNLAVQGCAEILGQNDHRYDVICCPVGTGGTISGIINSTNQNQSVIGFPALKGDFLSDEIMKYTKKVNWELMQSYHFGGYAKVSEPLIAFINTFKKEQAIMLDPVYTAKMFFGIFDMIQNGFFTKNTRILAIHTGGLQGIEGMNKRLLKKNLPIIEI